MLLLCAWTTLVLTGGCGPTPTIELPPGRAAQSAVSKLKHFGYYQSAYHFPGRTLEIDAFAEHTNFVDVRSGPLEQLHVPIEAAIARGQRIYLGITDDLVYRPHGEQGYRLRPNWFDIWSHQIRPTAQRYRAHLMAIGGVDEPGYRQMSSQDLRTMYRQFKADFPELPIFCNYTRYRNTAGQGGGRVDVPDECDWLGYTPGYGQETQGKENYDAMKGILRDKNSRTGKKHSILFVGDGYAGWDGATNGESMRIRKAEAAYERALQENSDGDSVDTVGFFVFVWGLIANENGQGVKYQPALKAKFASIGQTIRAGGPPILSVPPPNPPAPEPAPAPPAADPPQTLVPPTAPRFVGRIDGVDEAVRGWTCWHGRKKPAAVSVWAGGPAGQGVFIASATADRPSTNAIRQACGVSSGNFRFHFDLSSEIRRQHAGKKVFVYVLGASGPERHLANSGEFAIHANDIAATDPADPPPPTHEPPIVSPPPTENGPTPNARLSTDGPCQETASGRRCDCAPNADGKTCTTVVRWRSETSSPLHINIEELNHWSLKATATRGGIRIPYIPHSGYTFSLRAGSAGGPELDRLVVRLPR